MEDSDRLGTFPITNRGIQIWLFFLAGSDSVFQALLPCCSHPSCPPVAIDLALWESNYYRHPGSLRCETGCPELHHIYLGYQDMPHRNSFKIDDSAVLKEGFTSSIMWPQGLITGNTVMLSITDPLCVICYSCSQEYHFAAGFGHLFGQNWIHVHKEPGMISGDIYDLMLQRVPEHAQSMNKARSGAAGCLACVTMAIPLSRSDWVLQTSCVMWKRSRICGVRLEVIWDPHFSHVQGTWRNFDVDVSMFLSVHAYYCLIGHCLYREQTIPTVTGRVSRYAILGMCVAMSYLWMASP